MNEVQEDDLPEEQLTPEQEKEDCEAQCAAQAEMLDKLGMSLSKTRSEAIDYRANSGIENDWAEDREHYEGIDDSNRGELGSWDSKPLGQGALQDDNDTGSTVFFNITRSYCDTASARVGDMLLPTDDIGWSIAPTPIPDMISVASGDIPANIQRQIESQVPGYEVQGYVDKVVAGEKKRLEEAVSTAKRASKRIEDWHIECQYNSQMRLVIEESSIIGTGVLKGPIPALKKNMAFIEGRMVVEDTIGPVSIKVNAGNCYPDPSCGMNIQQGSYHWERDDISDKTLADLKGQDGYLSDQIQACLEEGPFKATKVQSVTELESGEQWGLARRDKSKLFEIWYYYGRLKKEDMEAAGLDVGEEADFPQVDVHFVMINNRVIRASENHLESGEFPYDYMAWQTRSGMPFGIGISRQIRVPQRVINGAGRNLMDNAGMAGGPMWVFNQGLIEPIDGNYDIAPRKGWFASEDVEAPDDIRKAISYIPMPMMQEDLQAIIQLGMQFAEQQSGLPSLLRGQQQGTQETLGGQQMRRNDGSSVLRRIARQYDDRITTPHLRRYYDWILLHGEDDEKGDFVIEARGSSALIDRDLQNQSILDMGSLVTNPVFGIDPNKWIDEYLRSQRLDPKNFKFDDEDWKATVEQMSAPPPDTSAEIAQMKIEFERQKLESTQLLKIEEVKNDNEQKERDRQLDMLAKQMEQEMDALTLQAEHINNKDLNIDKIKASLAETIMTLKAQLQVSADGFGPEVAEPVSEPYGRAENGKSFQE